MIRMIALAAGLLVSQAAPAAMTGMPDYQCTIKRVTSSMHDNDAVAKTFQDSYIGKVFTVNRADGVMSGALKNAYITKPIVIDYGSSENALKVVTAVTSQQSGGPGTVLQALNIAEYVDESAKPFVFADDDVVYFGHCVHF
jgi:hypothetical protein